MNDKLSIKSITPHETWCAVAIKKAKKTTKSGIITKSDNYASDKSLKERDNYLGQIEKVGEEISFVKNKDYVLFSKYAGYLAFSDKDKAVKLINDSVFLVKSKSIEMKATEVIPNNSSVLVDTKVYEIKTKAGLTIPEKKTASDPLQGFMDRAVVVSVGKDVSGHNKEDIVYITKDTGYDIEELDGEGNYKLIHYKDIIFTHKNK